MNSPHITYFIHNQNSITITCPQHCFTNRMMRTSNTVKTGFFQLSASALFCFFQRRSSQNSIVVMNACPSQFHFFSIHTKSMQRIQSYGPNTKRFYCFIQHLILRLRLNLNPTLIQIWCFTLPQFRIHDTNATSGFFHHVWV